MTTNTTLGHYRAGAVNPPDVADLAGREEPQ